MARKYEFYARVVRAILFFPREHKIHIKKKNLVKVPSLFILHKGSPTANITVMQVYIIQPTTIKFESLSRQWNVAISVLQNVSLCINNCEKSGKWRHRYLHWWRDGKCTTQVPDSVFFSRILRVVDKITRVYIIKTISFSSPYQILISCLKGICH